jgi:lipopolysaccharide biosynthesis glycosyltransferase
MNGGTAICFVLALPRRETRVEASDRALRVVLSCLPLSSRFIAPEWSPGRRMGFGAGLRACVQSLRRRHQSLPPVIVLRPRDQQVTLADVDAVVPFDTTAYASIPRVASYLGREVYYKLEIFNGLGFDRLVYLDCDTVVLDDISALWDPARFADRSFYAVRETADMGVHPSVIGRFNTGVMVVNRPLLCGDAYRRMLALAREGRSYDAADQGVINEFFESDRSVTAGELDAAFNVMVVARRFGRWDLFEDRIKILHFVNRLKPWAPDHCHDKYFDAEFKRLWDDAYGAAPPHDRTRHSERS